MKFLSVIFIMSLVVSCSSRTLKKDYKVMDASHQDIPEWVTDLDEWLDDEEEDFKKNRYYIYTTEAKNSRAIACEIAKARAATSVASEVSTYIKQSLAQSKHGDVTKAKGKVAEYVQEDLLKEVQATIAGARSYKQYWEKRSFDKELGATQNWTGYVCTSLVKISKKQLKNAFKVAAEKITKVADDKAKADVLRILEEAKEKYTN